MEIRDFATQVLYGTRLDDKLVSIGRITDTNPGSSLIGSVVPGRPANLQLSDSRPKIPFPKVSLLDDDKVRGQVLHFFANHELLALELMALTLLKFPDAPDRFRRTLIATMRDEQKHMRLYLSQMKKLGVEFGEIPVNSFFWSVISTMNSPMDFVARMSLTFEQANLDFSVYFRNAFKRVGDLHSAAVMDQVLADEVRHVRHGLEFFEQWRDPNLSTWEAHQRALPFPLSPARAKGSLEFTADHRRRAGLPDDYIKRLQLYQHSKGRSPSVYLFNPMAENRLARDRQGGTEKRVVRSLELDTETIPMFLAASDDVVLVRRVPDMDFIQKLARSGFQSPEFVPFEDHHGALVVDGNWNQRTFGRLCPWGWDTRTTQLLEPLESQLIRNRNDIRNTVLAYRKFSSKAWLASHLSELLTTLPTAWQTTCLTTQQPQVLTTSDAVQAHRDRLYDLGYEAVVVKASFGTAGGRAQRLVSGEDQSRQLKWISGILSSQQAVIVEPWYYRLVDLSYQFTIQSNGRVIHDGLTQFFTDISGRYRGTRIGAFDVGLSDTLRQFIYQGSDAHDWLTKACRHVVSQIARHIYQEGYHGRAGIDLMIVRDVDGSLRLRLPLELNCRATMGHVALRLKTRMSPRVKGLWIWLTRSDLARAGYPDFVELISDLHARLPTRIDTRCERIEQGVVSTTDPHRAQHVVTLILAATDDRLVDAVLSEIGLLDFTRPESLVAEPLKPSFQKDPNLF